MTTLNLPQAWTEERVEQLRSMWAAEDSTAVIGRAIGMTKNAVIGKARRLGLPMRQPGTPRSSGMSVRKHKARPAAYVAKPKLRPAPKAKRTGPNKWDRQEPTPVAYRPVPGVEPLRLGIMDLTRMSCREVVSGDGEETAYCGLCISAHGGSYCDAHAAKNHVHWPPRPIDQRNLDSERQLAANAARRFAILRRNDRLAAARQHAPHVILNAAE